MLRERGSGRFCRETVAGEGFDQVRIRRTGAGSEAKFCRTMARTRVTAALPEILDKFVEEAKKGSIPHAKALTAMGGLDGNRKPEGGAEPEGRPRQSFAGFLLKELKRQRIVQGDGGGN